jgi:branched-chain amino acid transport system substrate-binding protein
MRRRALTIVVAAIVVTVAACSGDDASGDARNRSVTTITDRHNVDGQLVLGALLPQSGEYASLYESLSTPVTMAVDEINAAGGVNGKDVALRAADDGSTVDVAQQSLARVLRSDRVDAVVGPAASLTTLGLVDTVSANHVVLCSGTNTSSAVANAHDDGYIFATAPDDAMQGPALAQLVLGDDKVKPAILARDDDYGRALSKSIRAKLEDGGAEVVVSATYDPESSDLSDPVAKVVEAEPDAVVVIGLTDDGPKIVKEMRAQGIGPDTTQLYAPDAMRATTFAAAVDPDDPTAVQGIKGTAPAAVVHGVTHPFLDAYAKTGTDASFSAYYYDCTMLVALAAEAAASDDGAKIADKMVDVSRGGERCQTYAACRALLDAGKNIDYDGASGAVDLVDAGVPDSGVYDVWAYGPTGSYANIEGAPQLRVERP